jgi:small subunit ribosomal protein S9
MATKTPTTSAKSGSAPVGKSTIKAPRKPRVTAKKKEAPPKEEAPEIIAAAAPMPEAFPTISVEKPTIAKGRYVFATGRRKTAIANVRLFSGSGETVVNKKSLKEYFQYSYHLDEVMKPFQLTGLENDFYFTSHINGGGMHSQAGALRHGIATALASLSDEIRKVLKKNGFLTRDDRKKERKKPGLKRARRSPQWAKR